MTGTLHDGDQATRAAPATRMRRGLRRRLTLLAYIGLGAVVAVAGGRALAHNPTCGAAIAEGSGWSFHAALDESAGLEVCYDAVPRQYLAHWDTTARTRVTNVSDQPVEVVVDWRLRSGETRTDATDPEILDPGERTTFATALRVGDPTRPTEMRVRVYAGGDRVYRAVSTAPTRSLVDAYLGWILFTAIMLALATWVLLGRDERETDSPDDQLARAVMLPAGAVWP